VKCSVIFLKCSVILLEGLSDGCETEQLGARRFETFFEVFELLIRNVPTFFWNVRAKSRSVCVLVAKCFGSFLERLCSLLKASCSVVKM